MPQTSSLPLALKFLLTPAGTKGSALHKSKLELCRNRAIVFYEDKSPPGFDSRRQFLL